jgi:hydroxymethylbilane synthase
LSPAPATDGFRLGTRASLLARTQSATVGDALAAVAGVPWHEVLIRTHGDDTTTSLNQPGRPGLFVSALRDALLAGEVDVIVHSFKDLPSAPEPGLVLGAVPVRADVRDALVTADGRGLADLPLGAVVGTSSPRRAASLGRMRSDLDIRPIRGNVDSRIAKVRSGEFDATVLAVAGLTRIGRADEMAEVLDGLLPAPAQGALAIECRSDDVRMRAWLAALDDPASHLVTAAEREVLVGIDAACTTAVAASGEYVDGRLWLRAELTESDAYSTAEVSAEIHIDDRISARALGLRAAAMLMGATDDRLPVLLVRSEGNDADAESLGQLGVPAVSDPYVQIAARRGGAEAERLATLLRESTASGQGTWLVATSPMAVPSWATAVGETGLAQAAAAAAAAGVRAAATGERTASTLRALGFDTVLLPEGSSARALVDALDGEQPARALFPCGNLALRTLPDGLRARGWQVEEAVVYDTAPVADRPASTVLLEAGAFAAVVLRSPSAVRALVSFVPGAFPARVVCAGETTATAAREAGLQVDAVAASPSSAHVATAVGRVLGLLD